MTASDLQISQATPRDFLSIAALDREVWRKLPQGEVIPDGEHAWRIWCEYALVYTARSCEGELAGAILAFPGLPDTFCVHKVMVAAPFRGKGVGTKLFQALLDQLDRRNAACFLTVAPDNLPAVTLYRKWGFTDERFVSGYYRESEDRLVLTRPAQAAALPSA